MANRDSLIVDTLASNVPPALGDVRQWASEQSVFVSSLIRDMAEERAAARRAITGFGAQPVMFEDELGAQDVPAETAYLDGLAQSSIYLGIYGLRYGVPLANRYSATEDEFRHADDSNRRMALFVVDSFDKADGPQSDFVGGARARYTTASYTSAAQLEQKIGDRLNALAAEEIMPWVVLGEVAFRADRITIRGGQVTLRAVVRSGRVADLLMSYAESRKTVPFAGPHDSGVMQVDAVATESTSATSRTMELTLTDRGNAAGSPMMFATVNGVTVDEQLATTLLNALSHADRPNQFGFPRLADPLEILRVSDPLPDQITRALARVLVSEALREQGVPGGASRFVLSPPRPDGRLLDVSWFPKKRYDNVPAPAERHITATVAPL